MNSPEDFKMNTAIAFLTLCLVVILIALAAGANHKTLVIEREYKACKDRNFE